MTVYKDTASLPAEHKGQMIAIGNFDGVHRGHRALLAEGKRMADAAGLKFGVLTFEPHPRALFRPDDPPFRITPPALKYKLLQEYGVDFIVSLNFTWEFASQKADDFVANILKNGLMPSHVLVGEEFRFGQLRKGSAGTIQAADIHVTSFSAVGDSNGLKYSSTDIREALRMGDVDKANNILGWDWEMSGEIFRGDQRGHELGFPTANVLLGGILHPAYGIYATWVQIEGEDQWRPAATNIGIRPMFELKVGQIEAHLLDFPSRDLYGKKLRVRPVQRLRGEAKFSSVDDLIAQMKIDCQQAREILV